MKKLYTFLLFFSALFASAQVDQKQKDLDNASFEIQSQYYSKADTIFARLNNKYPGDSTVLATEALTYWRYGHARVNEQLLSKAINKLVEYDGRYPSLENKLYIAMAKVKMCEAKIRTKPNPTPELRAELKPKFQVAKKELEDLVTSYRQTDAANYPKGGQLLTIADKDLGVAGIYAK